MKVENLEISFIKILEHTNVRGGNSCTYLRNYCENGCPCIKKTEQARLENNYLAILESEGKSLQKCTSLKCSCSKSTKELTTDLLSQMPNVLKVFSGLSSKRPLLIVENFVAGEGKGYGRNIPIVNDMERGVISSDGVSETYKYMHITPIQHFQDIFLSS